MVLSLKFRLLAIRFRSEHGHGTDAAFVPSTGHGRQTRQGWRQTRTTNERKLMNRPKIVCLCGSTRFYERFQLANFQETMAGNIVLSVGFYPHAACSKQAHGEDVGITPEQKLALDELHKRKIDLADEVLVLNVGGYIGSSTRSEIEYAINHGKPVRYLESIGNA